MVAKEKEQEEHKKQEAKRKAIETNKIIDEQVAQKKIQNQLKRQTDNLVHQIQHGDKKNEVDRESIRNYSQGRTAKEEKAINKIIKQHREKADARAEPRTERNEFKYTMNDVRKWDCNKDAKPVDGPSWGNATYMKTPTTSYSMTY